MATNVTLTNLRGENETVDVELIADLDADIDAMTDAQLADAGVSKGTRITLSTGSPVEVLESRQLVKTIAQAALGVSRGIGAAITRDGMPAATQVFNAAGPAAITGLSITGLAAGNYLFVLSGVAESSDVANCGATFQLAKAGVGIGLLLSAPATTFGTAAAASKGLGQLGFLLFDAAVPADVYTVLVGVVPGGVGGDDITVTDVTLTAIRLA